MSLTVGVVVPAYGEAAYLGETLEALVRQSRPPDEIVVVDDASPEPLRLASDHARHCRLLRRGERGGPGVARNTGIATLRSGWVALNDADDTWEMDKLAVQLESLERNAQAAICFGRAIVVGHDGEPTGERWEEPHAGLLPHEEFTPALFAGNPIPTSSAVVQRGALEAVGGFAPNIRVGEDWDLWLRLAARRNDFLCEPQAVIHYRRSPASLSANLTELAEWAITIHDLHAELADEEARRRARARDLVTLARARVRERRYGGARRALRDAGAFAPPSVRERAMRAVLAIPVLRGAMGRRRPYR